MNRSLFSPSRWAIWVMLLLLPVACNSPYFDYDGNTSGPEDTEEGLYPIRFEATIALPEDAGEEPDGPETKLRTGSDLKTSWEDGDAFGVFAVARLAGQPVPLEPSGNYIHNLKVVYNSATRFWEPEKTVYWKNNYRHDLYAYYPYDNNLGNPDLINPQEMLFNISSDQSGSFSYLMTAKADTGRWRDSSLVEFQFHIATGMVEVNVPVEGKGFGPDENLTVRLRNVQPSVVLDLNKILRLSVNNGVTLAAENNDPVTFTMQRVEPTADQTGYTYRATVPVQRLGQTDLLWFEHEDRQLFTASVLSPDLKFGKVERYEISLSKAIHTVPVPSGSFTMGSPVSETGRQTDETGHAVTLTRSFNMSKYPVTNAQYAAFLNDTGIDGTGTYGTADYGSQTLIVPTTGLSDWGMHWNNTDERWEPAPGCGDYPVVNVTWYGADEYARWVGGKLPTEAQWEYACRAGTDTPWSFGNSIAEDYLWYSANSGGQSQTVGEKLPNPQGLYDMHGLVKEWCSDWYDAYPGGAATDPAGPSAPTGKRVLRGGSFSGASGECRSASRFSENPDSYGGDIGFRVIF